MKYSALIVSVLFLSACNCQDAPSRSYSSGELSSKNHAVVTSPCAKQGFSEDSCVTNTRANEKGDGVILRQPGAEHESSTDDRVQRSQQALPSLAPGFQRMSPISPLWSSTRR
jgi:hypothetical protein